LACESQVFQYRDTFEQHVSLEGAGKAVSNGLLRDKPSIRWPFSQISPEVGCSHPVTMLKSVVFPAPLGPITA